MKFISLIAVVLISGCGEERATIKVLPSIKVSWQQPTEFEDGQVLEGSELDSFHINWEEESGLMKGDAIVKGYKGDYIITELISGNYHIEVRSRTVYGVMSEPVKISKKLFEE
ncbi:MAG: hypothetical protein RPR97_19510 [Colwellia sp.]